MADPGFDAWFKEVQSTRKAMGMPLRDKPDSKEYDYKAAYRRGFKPSDLKKTKGHFPSYGKDESNQRAVVEGINTKTGRQQASPLYTGPVTEKTKKQEGYWRKSGTARKTKAAGWDRDDPVLPKKVQEQIARAKKRKKAN